MSYTQIPLYSVCPSTTKHLCGVQFYKISLLCSVSIIFFVKVVSVAFLALAPYRWLHSL